MLRVMPGSKRNFTIWFLGSSLPPSGHLLFVLIIRARACPDLRNLPCKPQPLSLEWTRPPWPNNLVAFAPDAGAALHARNIILFLGPSWPPSGHFLFVLIIRARACPDLRNLPCKPQPLSLEWTRPPWPNKCSRRWCCAAWKSPSLPNTSRLLLLCGQSATCACASLPQSARQYAQKPQQQR